MGLRLQGNGLVAPLLGHFIQTPSNVQIRKIQFARITLGRPLRSLAAEFGVSTSTVKSALSIGMTTTNDE
jgi:hypothetical protein